MSGFFKCLPAFCFALAVLAPLSTRAETCPSPDDTNWVSGANHCLAIKTYLPTGGTGHVLMVVLHGDLSSGGPADDSLDFAKTAAEAGAVGVAMARPGYMIDGRESSGIPTRNQDREDRFKPAEIDSIAQAVAALKAHHKAERVVMFGHSGGAIISGVMLGRSAPLVDAVILLSCPCNYADWRESNDWPAVYGAESPQNYLEKAPKTARIFTLTGENDGNTKMWLATDYVKKAVGLGLNATFTPIPGANHGLRRIKRQPQIFDAIRAAVTSP
ncbi:MAG: hypothetical protein CMF68_02290 [Magnetovibrio sp.]|nr:hypothetical protein [Magnetovibrio sp.]